MMTFFSCPLQIDLPDFEKMRQDAKMTPDEMRSRMKKDGQVPPRSFQERPMNIASTGQGLSHQ